MYTNKVNLQTICIFKPKHGQITIVNLKFQRFLLNTREFKQSTTAGATTAAVTGKGLGRVRLGGLLNFKLSETKYKETRLRSLKPLLFSFAQPNSFAQRRMAVVRLARTNILFLSKKRVPYTLYDSNILMDEIYNFRDKYLKEYRVKNTHTSILKEAK